MLIDFYHFGPFLVWSIKALSKFKEEQNVMRVCMLKAMLAAQFLLSLLEV